MYTRRGLDMKTHTRSVGEPFILNAADRPRRRDRPRCGHAHLLRRLAGLLDCGMECVCNYPQDRDNDQHPLYWAQRFALVALREPLDELRKILVGAWGESQAVDTFLDVLKKMCDFVLQMHFVPPKPSESWKVKRQIIMILDPFWGACGDAIRHAIMHGTHKRDPVAMLYYAAHRFVK